MNQRKVEKKEKLQMWLQHTNERSGHHLKLHDTNEFPCHTYYKSYAEKVVNEKN